ncbi:MAG: glycoside hydrolase family 92 protein, partial [Bacteroidaceae bacterium]|nr:glycoside hydrolase family 92 protein [Bacteroidaceae bacterium]
VERHVEFDLKHFLGRSETPKAREAQQFEDYQFTELDDRQWQGSQTISGGWNNGAPYTVYFYAQAKNTLDHLLLKVSLSFVSIEQAKANMKTDIKGWDFEATVKRCRDVWDETIGRFALDDSTSPAQRRMFYTALYHMCLMPTDRNEAGVARPYDDYYAIWDTYRTSTPLLTLLAPDRATAMAQSLLDIYRQDGFMPDARSGNSNGRTQGGSNAEIVLADAMARGLQLDYELALEAMLKDATVPPKDDEAEGRGGLAEYNTLGYIPYGIARAGNRTLEYSFCDWAISEVARRLGKTDLASQYLVQSHRWRNLWRDDYEHDGTRGFIMPRDAEGNWLDSVPYGHSQLQPLHFRYTPDVSYEGPWYCAWWDCFMYEASSWEYSFSIPHDIPGLIHVCGGKDAFERRLDTFFQHGYYNVANEPSFLTPLLYHFIGKPNRSADRIRNIIAENFSDQPNGLPGNDDGGAMSSWLACNMLGLYPLAGTDQWLLCEPLVPGVTLRLANGNTLRIQRGDVNRLNGKALDGNTITHDQLLQGGTLVLRQYPSTQQYLFTYKLHGQTRRFRMEICDKTLYWSIVRNLKTWRGSYTWTQEAQEHATSLCYEQPLDGQALTMPDDQLFAMLSQEALRNAQEHGVCTFCNTPCVVRDRKEGMLHLVDTNEGAEMWVRDDVTLPLIMEMRNNPVEINWKAEKIR